VNDSDKLQIPEVAFANQIVAKNHPATFKDFVNNVVCQLAFCSADSVDFISL